MFPSTTNVPLIQECTDERLQEIGTKRRPIGTHCLTPYLISKAMTELGETEQKRQYGLKTLRDLIHRNNIKFLADERHLLIFLRNRKFDVPKALTSIKLFRQMVIDVDERHGIPDAGDIIKVLKTNCVGLLPFKDHEERSIVYFKTDLYFNDQLTVKEAVHTILTITLFLLRDPATQISGVVMILDLEHTNASNISHLVDLLRIIISIARCDPGRFKRVNVLHEGTATRLMLRLIKPLLPLKVINRIKCHNNDIEGLLEYFDPSLLPLELGGTHGPLNNDHWINRVEETVNYYNGFVQKCKYE